MPHTRFRCRWALPGGSSPRVAGVLLAVAQGIKPERCHADRATHRLVGRALVETARVLLAIAQGHAPEYSRARTLPEVFKGGKAAFSVFCEI